jgi:hypothetical protein
MQHGLEKHTTWGEDESKYQSTPANDSLLLVASALRSSLQLIAC